MTPVLDVRDLRVELIATGDDVVDGISFSIEAGEVLGIVGESGSGKTTVGTAILGHARRGARIAGGAIHVDGVDILRLAPAALRRLRGKLVSYIPQDPAAALNPALRIGKQLEELLEVHEPAFAPADRRSRIVDVLREASLPAGEDFLRRYPHQLSGGQQQRVCIAMAFVLRPRMIVLDEPTTGLDVTTQAHVLETVRHLCEQHGVAALYVSHDLAVVANVARRVLVMYAGRLAELGARHHIFERPAHPYTRLLLAAIPDVAERRALEAISGQAPAPRERPPGCFFAPRCPYALEACRAGEPPVIEVDAGHHARCLRALEVVAEPARPRTAAVDTVPDGGDAVLQVTSLSAFFGPRQVLHDVTLELRAGECLALVGESGSGKTTLARSIIGLTPDRRGDVRFRGSPLAKNARERPASVRRALQYVFQSPYNSLNPRKTIGEIVEMPLRHFFGLRGRAARLRVDAVLERVALSPKVAVQYPDQLSGGERQRVAIARALLCEPEVLICDEITSALDVSVQAAIVELLERLQEEEGLSMLFVTHNLAVVRTIADRVAVLYEGRIVETGATADVLDRPAASYTRKLLADTPTLAASVPVHVNLPTTEEV